MDTTLLKSSVVYSTGTCIYIVGTAPGRTENEATRRHVAWYYHQHCLNSVKEFPMSRDCRNQFTVTSSQTDILPGGAIQIGCSNPPQPNRNFGKISLLRSSCLFGKQLSFHVCSNWETRIWNCRLVHQPHSLPKRKNHDHKHTNAG